MPVFVNPNATTSTSTTKIPRRFRSTMRKTPPTTQKPPKDTTTVKQKNEIVKASASPSTSHSSPCPEFELRCVDGLCITLDQICDKVKRRAGLINQLNANHSLRQIQDCTDNSDELHCEYDNWIRLLTLPFSPKPIISYRRLSFGDRLEIPSRRLSKTLKMLIKLRRNMLLMLPNLVTIVGEILFFTKYIKSRVTSFINNPPYSVKLNDFRLKNKPPSIEHSKTVLSSFRNSYQLRFFTFIHGKTYKITKKGIFLSSCFCRLNYNLWD